VPYDVEKLPTSQWSEVRFFDKTSPLGAILVVADEVGDEADKRCAVRSIARRPLSWTRFVRCSLEQAY
jgi:hypothetical protein